MALLGSSKTFRRSDLVEGRSLGQGCPWKGYWDLGPLSLCFLTAMRWPAFLHCMLLLWCTALSQAGKQLNQVSITETISQNLSSFQLIFLSFFVTVRESWLAQVQIQVQVLLCPDSVQLLRSHRHKMGLCNFQSLARKSYSLVVKSIDFRTRRSRFQFVLCYLLADRFDGQVVYFSGH